MNDRRDFQGRRILVTGGASGIGAASARMLAAGGAMVVILDRNADMLAQTGRELDAPTIHLDLSDLDHVPASIERAADMLGGLDGIVNCAGVTLRKKIEDIELKDWQRTLAVNLTGPFVICQAALPHLRSAKCQSTIVNVSSGAALLPSAARAAYSSSKAGLLMLTKIMALEFAPKIRVNSVAPGTIRTPFFMGNAAFDEAERKADEAGKLHAVGRVGTAEEVAEVVRFLMGPQSSFITGSTISVDGGRAYY